MAAQRHASNPWWTIAFPLLGAALVVAYFAGLLPKDQPLEEGQAIFIQPKRNKSRAPEYHAAELGETLWGISQRYGVKLKKLAAYNGIGIADPLTPGQRVWLRKPRH